MFGIKTRINKLLQHSIHYRRFVRMRHLRKTLSRSEWLEIKHRNYQYIRNLRSLQWSVAKHNFPKIITIGIIMMMSSLLIMIAVIMPMALNVFKQGVLNQFGDYHSYSTYYNTPLNVPINKGNMQQQFQGSQYYSGTGSPDPGLSAVGAFKMNNGNSMGVDNRPSLFASNDPMQTSFFEQYVTSAAGLTGLTYLGGYVLSSSWIAALNKLQLPPTTVTTICGYLGVNTEGMQNPTISDCVEVVIKQNAPAYIAEKLFGGEGHDFFITMDALSYNYLTDTMFTNVNGVYKEDYNVSTWGLNPNSNLQLHDTGNNDLMNLLVRELPAKYEGKNIFPCIVNQTFAHRLKMDNLVDNMFKYTTNYKILEYKQGSDWVVVNPNNYYWYYNYGLSTYFDVQTPNGAGATAGTAGFFNSDSLGGDINRHGTADRTTALMNSIDALVAQGKMRITSIPFTVNLKVLGIANLYGDPRIYMTRSEANELSGYYAPLPNVHHIYSNDAIAPWALNTSVNGSLFTETNYTNTATSLKPVTHEELTAYIHSLRSSAALPHIASDGHPYQYKYWNDFAYNELVSQLPNATTLSGGYTLDSSTPAQTDIYYNSRLSLNEENADFSVFPMGSLFGAYDRFGIADPNNNQWDPTNNSTTPLFSCTGGSDPNCIGSSNQGTSMVETGYSQYEVVMALNKATTIALLIIYSMLIFFIIIALVIVVLSTNIVIDDNKKNISGFKIMGYRDSEIMQIVTRSYLYATIVAFVLMIPIIFGTFMIFLNHVGVLLGLNIAESGLGILDVVTWWEILAAFLILMLVYFSSIFVNKQMLNKIKPIDILKG